MAVLVWASVIVCMGCGSFVVTRVLLLEVRVIWWQGRMYIARDNWNGRFCFLATSAGDPRYEYIITEIPAYT